MPKFILRPQEFKKFASSVSVLVACLCLVLRHGVILWCLVGIIDIWFITVVYVSARFTCKPFGPDYQATLKVFASSATSWLVHGVYGELLYEGSGSENILISKSSSYRSRSRRTVVAEFACWIEVVTPDGDVLTSLTVETDDEISSTVAVRSDDKPQLVYTSVPSSYGTKHWLYPACLQGVPRF